MNVRIRASYSAIRMPRCEATPIRRLWFGPVAAAHPDGQRRVARKPRILLREPAQIEDRTLRGGHRLAVHAGRTEADAVVGFLPRLVGHQSIGPKASTSVRSSSCILLTAAAGGCRPPVNPRAISRSRIAARDVTTCTGTFHDAPRPLTAAGGW